MLLPLNPRLRLKEMHDNTVSRHAARFLGFDPTISSGSRIRKPGKNIKVAHKSRPSAPGRPSWKLEHVRLDAVLCILFIFSESDSLDVVAGGHDLLAIHCIGARAREKSRLRTHLESSQLFLSSLRAGLLRWPRLH